MRRYILIAILFTLVLTVKAQQVRVASIATCISLTANEGMFKLQG